MASNSSDLAALQQLADELQKADDSQNRIRTWKDSITRVEGSIAEWELPLRNNLSDTELRGYGCSHNTHNSSIRRAQCLAENQKLYEEREKKLKSFVLITILLAAAVFFALVGVVALTHPEATETFGFSLTEEQLNNAMPVLTGCILASWVLVLIAVCAKKTNRSDKLTRKQKAWVREAERLDLENYQKNLNEVRTKAPGRIKKYQQDIRDFRSFIKDQEDILRMQKLRIGNMKVLADRDKNLETVQFLIDQMESGRANSLTEALQQYDERMRERDRIHFQIEQSKLRRETEDMQRAQESEDRLRQTLHNIEMERQAQKTLKEIEKLRKDAESYRRYGNP